MLLQEKPCGRLPHIKTKCPKCGGSLRSGSTRTYLTYYYCTARCGYSFKRLREVLEPFVGEFTNVEIVEQAPTRSLLSEET